MKTNPSQFTTRKLLVPASLALVTLLAFSPALRAQTLITNGGFESGSPPTLPGWATSFAGPYFSLVTSPPSWVYGGTTSAFLNIFGGAGPGVTDLTSDQYGATPGQTYDLSLAVRAISGGPGSDNTFNSYGTIFFYNSLGGLLSSQSTSSQLATSAAPTWQALTVNAVAPVGTSYFVVAGETSVTTTVPDGSYSEFDAFSVTAIPEPETILLLVGVGISLSLFCVRRRLRKPRSL